MARYERDISRTFHAGMSPNLDIRGVNGSITVRGQEREDVSVRAQARFRVHSDEEAAGVIRSLEAGIRAEGDAVIVHAPDSEDAPDLFDGIMAGLRYGFGRYRHLKIDIEVIAPRGASLELRSCNGHVEVRDLLGDAGLRMVNGGYFLENLAGDVSFRLVNGEGLVRDVAGALDMDYKNGRTRIERVGGDLTLKALNSRIEIAGAGAAVSASALNGALRFSGPVRGDVSFELRNGPIVLSVPSDSRFDLDASSETGSVTSELPVRDTRGDSGDQRLPSVRLRTHTGSIRLEVMRDPVAAGVT